MTARPTKIFDAYPKVIGGAEGVMTDRSIFYEVPTYQRNYTWQDNQIDELWEDLLDEDASDFFGTFVLNYEKHNGYKGVDIVDGQQRLITLTMLLALLRNHFILLDENGKALEVQKLISMPSEASTYRVRPAANLKDFLEEYIQKFESNTENLRNARTNTKEEGLVKENFLQFNSLLSQELSRLPEKNLKINFLDRLFNKIGELGVVVIKVWSQEDAFTFFETVNARGLRLSTADVLKNLIFKNLSDQDTSTIERKWQNILDNLREGDDVFDMPKFLRHFWLSKYKKVPEKKIFREIKGNVTDYLDFLKILDKESEYYNKIIFPSDSDFTRSFLKIYRHLKNIKTLGVQNPYSFLLTLLRIIHRRDYAAKYKTKLILEAFSWVEKFTFQYTTIANKSRTALDPLFSKYAIALDKAKDSAAIEIKLKELRAALISLLPTKSEFFDNFIKLAYSNSDQKNKVLKYIFEKLNYAGKDEQFFFSVSIEHVLPRNPEKGWGLSATEVAPYVDGVGNLTILGPRDNNDASNKVLKVKTKYYRKSQIEITKKLGQKLSKQGSRWNQKSIEVRASQLARKAFTLWKLS